MIDEFSPHTTVSSLRGANEQTTVTSLPVADFSTSDTTPGAMTIRRDVAVKQLAVKNEEILVDAKIIHRCRQKLQRIKSIQFTWSELLLGISAAGFGIIASAYLSDIKLDSTKGVFSFVITPCLTVGTGVAYVIFRNLTHISSSQIADEILEELPNPDETVEVEVAK